MFYKRQHFTKGQVLTAEQMNKVDKWLAHICGKELVSGEVNSDGELELMFKDGETISLGAVGSTNIDVTAKVGQTIIVKAIDANGNPLSWKAVDLPVDGGNPEAVTLAIEAALAEAKASGEFDGKDGENGKSAYAYAQDGGYEGTEAQFAEKLAEATPTKLPNPHALTINGKSYDGSKAVSVNIEGGSGGETVYATITYNIENGETTSAMTAAEIMAAYKSGHTVVAVIMTSGNVIDAREGAAVLAPYSANILVTDIITKTNMYHVLIECADPSNPENGRITVQHSSMTAGALVGTTAEITPSQVAEAVAESRPVRISHTDKWGTEYLFTSFNILDDLVIGEVLLTAVYDNSGIDYATFPYLKGILGDNEQWFFDETLRMATVEGLPTTLPNPNALTINGKVYDGSEPVTVNFEGGIDAEWVATSEIIGNNDIVIAEQTLSSGLWSKGQTKLVLGMTYEVYVNDVCYLCVCYSHNDGGWYLGNGTLAGSNSTPHNNEPFCILAYSDSATSGTFYRDSNALSYPLKLKVTGHSYVKYNKLPKEYLPDDIGVNIDVTAEVGQTIVVEEVDGSGKPTKWRAADYQPRTHWQGEKVMCAENTFEAGLVGKNIVTHGFDIMGLTIGKTYIVVFDGVSYTCVAEAGTASLDGVNMYDVISIGNLSMFGGTDNGLPFILGDLPNYNGIATGVCLPHVYGEHTLSVTGVDETTTIPEKYLREGYPYYIDVFGETSASASTSTAFTCNDTVENVRAIFNSGREVKVRYTERGVNAIPYTLYLTLFFHGEADGKMFIGFCSANIYPALDNVLIYLVSKEDGTFNVSQSIGD